MYINYKLAKVLWGRRYLAKQKSITAIQMSSRYTSYPAGNKPFIHCMT